ncbi:hypothetical protein GCM10027048_05140 [Hymenobacter coalescens]
MKRFVSTNCQDCPAWSRSPLACCPGEAPELAELSKTCQQYQRGQFIFREGSHPLGMYCVHSGSLKVRKVGGDGKEHIVRLAKEGDVLGYRALLAGEAHSADAVALDDAVVCLLPRAGFFRLVEHHAPFASAMMKLLSSALGEAEERMLHLAYKPVRERLAEALLLLLRTYSHPASPQLISVTRDDLAALVGTAKETVSRFMAELKNEGVLRTKGRQITVLNPTRLVEIATLYE